MKRWRHFLVAIFIVPFFFIYSLICIYFANFITGYYWFFDFLIFLFLGFIWIIPILKIINWLADKEAK